MADEPRPILFDTDIGSDVDDALALALILAVPETLSLQVVTTVAGDTALRARIAASLLGLAKHADALGDHLARDRPDRAHAESSFRSPPASS